MTDKKSLSERGICSKYINMAITGAGRHLHTHIREEVGFTKGRIIVRDKLHTRDGKKHTDYILYKKVEYPLAAIDLLFWKFVPIPKSRRHCRTAIARTGGGDINEGRAVRQALR